MDGAYVDGSTGGRVVDVIGWNVGAGVMIDWTDRSQDVLTRWREKMGE